MTIDNEVDYQNGLTSKNASFASAADLLFCNYKWTKERLDEAESMSDKYGLHPKDIFFGVDVWAQNTNMPGPKRTTFPQKGGGGTNTGVVSLDLMPFL